MFEDVLPESWLPTFLGKFVQCKSRLRFEMVTKSNQCNVKKWFIPVRIDPQYVPYFYSFYQDISKNQKELNLWQKLLKCISFSFISSTSLEGSMEYYDSESSSILRRTNPFLTKFYHENPPVVSQNIYFPDVHILHYGINVVPTFINL